jgi:hypothetical protein
MLLLRDAEASDVPKDLLLTFSRIASMSGDEPKFGMSANVDPKFIGVM